MNQTKKDDSHGIIFDCDGTLVNSLDFALQSFSYALAAVNAESVSIEQIRSYFGAGADRIFLKILGDETRALEAFNIYLVHQSSLADKTQLHNGVCELLAKLKAEEIPMAIVTGRHFKDLSVLLAPHNLMDSFGAIIGDNHLPHSKPAPDGILLAAKRLGLHPSNTFYVGDSVTDLQAAHNAGSIPVAALWDPLVKESELILENPRYKAHKPCEVWEHFQKHFRN